VKVGIDLGVKMGVKLGVNHKLELLHMYGPIENLLKWDNQSRSINNTPIIGFKNFVLKYRIQGACGG